jgi:predicted flavoprotein YhiN
MSPLPVIVVGAGAAGLMAARFAALAGAPVLLLERTADGGRKILISGGGRCNVLPGTFRPEAFVTDSSRNTLKKILRSWPLAEQRRYFEEELGIPLKHEVEFDKLFPVSDRARDVRDGLVAAVRQAGGTIRFGTRAISLDPPSPLRGPEDRDPTGDQAGAPRGSWRVTLEGGEVLEGAAVILATGGLSVPATGSDGAGLSLLEVMGHVVHPPYPALTPLLANPPVHATLAGVSLTVTLTSPGSRPRFRTTGGFLFTHRGYSGPAVLDASHLASRHRAPLHVQWVPGMGAEEWDSALRMEPEAPGAEAFRDARATVGGILQKQLPRRLTEQLLSEADVPRDRALAALRREERHRLARMLGDYPLPWTGDEGYKKAEVTGGGVALDQVDPRTLESRVRPGLYICGEVLDAFGPIGGHNFLWAWATGRAAGVAAGEAVAQANAAPGGPEANT